MSTKEIESIHAVVSSTLCFHSRYSVTMKNVFRFACELFILWQVVMYGVLSVTNIQTTIFGVIGILLLVCTAISLYIYNANARELEEHSKVISDIEFKPRSVLVQNVEKFTKVFEKYKTGRNLIFIMNMTSVCYIVIFAITTMLYQILR